METRANYVLIGSFVMLAAAALVMFAVWVSRVQFNQEFAMYDVVFEGPVNGLSEGGEVRFNGIKVGEVTNLALDRRDPNHVIARIRVDAQTPVREDSKAVLDFMGITGVTFIQIHAGHTNKPMLLDISKDTPPRIYTEKTQLEELFAGGQNLIATGGETLQNINAVFTEENIESLTGLLSNLKKMSDFAAGDGDIVAETRTAIQSMTRAGDAVYEAAVALDAATVDFDKRVALMTNDTLAMLEEARVAIGEAKGAFEAAEQAIQDTNSALTPEAERALSEVSDAGRDLRVLLDRLSSIAEDVERDPREFVFGDAKPFE